MKFANKFQLKFVSLFVFGDFNVQVLPHILGVVCIWTSNLVLCTQTFVMGQKHQKRQNFNEFGWNLKKLTRKGKTHFLFFMWFPLMKRHLSQPPSIVLVVGFPYWIIQQSFSLCFIMNWSMITEFTMVYKGDN